MTTLEVCADIPIRLARFKRILDCAGQYCQGRTRSKATFRSQNGFQQNAYSRSVYAPFEKTKCQLVQTNNLMQNCNPSDSGIQVISRSGTCNKRPQSEAENVDQRLGPRARDKQRRYNRRSMFRSDRWPSPFDRGPTSCDHAPVFGISSQAALDMTSQI